MAICSERETTALLFGGMSVLGFNIALLRRPGLTLVPFCSPRSRLPAVYDWPRICLEDESALRQLFRAQQPDLLIHCGAVCDVDKCEADPEFAYQVNVASIERLLRRLPEKTRLVYCSSDHVFGGGPEPFTELSATAPISAYGRMRLAAERLVLRWPDALVLRCSLAIGPSVNGRGGHLDWLRYRTLKGLPMTVVCDEHRSASWAEDLASRVLALALSSERGLRHVSTTRCVSRLDLASYLSHRFAIGARFDVEHRAEQPIAHLGRVELATIHRGPLAKPLPAVVPKDLRKG